MINLAIKLTIKRLIKRRKEYLIGKSMNIQNFHGRKKISVINIFNIYVALLHATKKKEKYILSLSAGIMVD